MKRVLAGSAALLSACALTALGPAPHAAAYAEQCTNESFAGTPLQQGTPTTNPPSSYRATTEGVAFLVGPIAGVGTLDVRATVHEVGVAVRNVLGTGLSAFAGIDYMGGGAYGQEWAMALCGSAGGLGGTLYVDVDDPIPTRPGVVVRMFFCSPAGVCTTVLGHTGVEVNLGVPATTCVWIDGRQQNPVAPCPLVDGGSVLPV